MRRAVGDVDHEDLRTLAVAELGPVTEQQVVDHQRLQLPDLASEFFGVSCSSRQLETLLQDARRELSCDSWD